MRLLLCPLLIPAIKIERYITHLVSRNPSNIWPDAIIIDLEDSIPPGLKISARQDVCKFLSNIQDWSLPKDIEVLIRINSVQSEYYKDDIESIASHLEGGNTGICIPKLESVDDIKRVLEIDNLAKTRVLPLIETIQGYNNRDEILSFCSANDIIQVAFGAGDMSRELEVERDYSLDILKHVILDLQIACKQYGISLVDSPSRVIPKTKTHQSWEFLLEEECRWSNSNGINSKLSIHPEQIPVIHRIFRPDDKIAWAKSILASFDDFPEKRSLIENTSGRYMGTPSLKTAQDILDRHVPKKEQAQDDQSE